MTPQHRLLLTILAVVTLPVFILLTLGSGLVAWAKGVEHIWGSK